MEVEKLKVIISANTAQFKKGMDDANKQLSGLSKSGSKAGMAMKAIGAVAGAAFKVVAGAAVAATTALTALSKGTEEMRKEQAKLNTAFLAAGSSAAVASKTYGELYRFLGDSGKATEAAAHLAKLTTNEKELAEWTTALQGIYGTFGDSLPIESLTEAANETAKVGTVTGTLADALNWAGINEDAFNASLAACNTEQERQNLIRNTLNGTYAEAARLYEETNKELLAQNEAQNNLNQTMAQLGKVATPVLTAITNLANAFMTALTPAITAITPYIVGFINLISTAVNWVSSLISSLLGTKAAGGAMSGAMATIANSANSAAGGASGITDGLGEATKQAEKLKRATAGFDELNVMSSGSTGGSSGSGAGAGSGGIGNVGGGAIVGGAGLTDAFDGVAASANGFGEKVKQVFRDIKNTVSEYLELFTPTVEAWGGAFESIGNSWNGVKDNFYNGAVSIGDSLLSLGEYLLGDFIPNITNSFSTNLAPLFSDVAGFWLEEAGATFEMYGEHLQLAVDEIITPALENLKTITTDSLDTVGKAWDEHGGTLLENLGTAFDGLRETWDNFYKEVVLPIATAVNEFVDEVWKESLKPLWDKIVDVTLSITNDLLELWNVTLKPIVDWVLNKLYPPFKTAFNLVLSIVKTVISTVSGILGGVMTTLKGLVQFITGVFTGNWRKAWDGIKNIVSGIWDAIWAAIKGVANLIIDGINTLWSGIYHAVKGIVDTIGDVAGVIGKLLGQDWGFSMPDKPPLIPKLATGGIVTKSTIANIGERGKEAVLPLENNTGWMDILADRIAAKNNTPSKIVLMLDGKELGWASINNINNITKQTGVLPLVLA